MGIFTGIGMITPDASRMKRAIRSLEKRRAHMMIEQSKNNLENFKRDAPRAQAGLKQGMFARGLGKSTIFEQDKARMDRMQEQQLSMLEQQAKYARRYLTYIHKKHHWEKVSQYYEAIDGIIGLAGGASSSPSMSYGADPYSSGGMVGGGGGGAVSYGAYGGGAYGVGAGAAAGAANYYTGY